MIKKIILFGAGDGGIRALYSLTNGFEVIAFADNDPRKQETFFLGKPVISPEKIKEWEYDYIAISNIYGEQVINQLINDLGVLRHQIIDIYNNLVFDSRIALLRQIADEIKEANILGSVAELGVYKGEFAKYINATFPDRTFYLFDTFEGFHENDTLYDSQNNLSNAEAGEFKDTDHKLVLGKMPNPEKCMIRQGYFPTAIETKDLEEKFVFVSLDVDLYKPIFEGLKYFYPRLQEGGYMFIHDYNNSRFFGVKEAVKDYLKINKMKYVPVTDLCGSLVIVK